tara:strand:- start:3079 stop:4212 length:1134 start_codon:yes stop_codon:yes gene_type:complete
MKIIQIGNTRLPSEKAHTRQIIEMANSLQSKYDSILYVPKRFQDNPTLKKNKIEKFYNIKKLKIKFLFGFDDIYWNKKIGMKVFLYILRILLNFIHLIFVLNKNTDYVYSRELLLTVLLKIFGYKSIFEIHQFNTPDMSKSAFGKILKFHFLFNKSPLHLIAISKNLKKKITNYWKYKNLKIDVLHDAYRNLNNVKLIDKTLYDFCYSGQLFENKGIIIIIKVAKLFPKKKFLIIGGRKELVKKYKNISKSLKLKNIKFTGFLSPIETGKYIKISKILLLPQIDETAESPLKLFEYLSYGKPIFASSTKPIKEILKNKKNALLFNPGDIDGLKKIILLYFNDFKLLNSISKNAKKESTKYTWNKRTKKLIKIMKKIK